MDVRRLAIGLLATAIAAPWFGCISYLTVKKAGPDVEGIRYSLPQPFVLVKPGKGGTLEVEVIYLPDPDNEYAIDPHSYLASTQFDVTVADGLLKQVTFNPDAAAIAKQVFESTGNVGEAQINAMAAAEKEEATKRTAAKDAVAKARLDLEQAKATLETLKRLKAEGWAIDPKDIIAAEVSVAKLELTLEQATTTARGLGFNMRDASTKADLPTAWGPILYRVVDTGDSVSLEAVLADCTGGAADQCRFETIRPPAAKPDPIRFALPGGSDVARVKTRLAFKVEISRPVYEVFDPTLDHAGDDVTRQYKPTLSLQIDGKSIVVDLSQKTPPGDYDFAFAYKEKSDGDTGSQSFKISVSD